jgi:hypothetical protein
VRAACRSFTTLTPTLSRSREREFRYALSGDRLQLDSRNAVNQEPGRLEVHRPVGELEWQERARLRFRRQEFDALRLAVRRQS